MLSVGKGRIVAKIVTTGGDAACTAKVSFKPKGPHRIAAALANKRIIGQENRGINSKW